LLNKAFKRFLTQKDAVSIGGMRNFDYICQ